MVVAVVWWVAGRGAAGSKNFCFGGVGGDDDDDSAWQPLGQLMKIIPAITTSTSVNFKSKPRNRLVLLLQLSNVAKNIAMIFLIQS